MTDQRNLIRLPVPTPEIVRVECWMLKHHTLDGIKVAETLFGELRPTEVMLLVAVLQTKFYQPPLDDGDHDILALFGGPGATIFKSENAVRSQILRWALSSASKLSPDPSAPIRIRALVSETELASNGTPQPTDLRAISCAGVIAFEKCVFPNGLLFDGSRLEGISFRECEIGSQNGGGLGLAHAEVRAQVLLARQTVVHGGLRLHRAQIAGHVLIQDCVIHASQTTESSQPIPGQVPPAIDAAGATIRGSCVIETSANQPLDWQCEINGRIDVSAATCDGGLRVVGANIKPAGTIAFDGSGAKFGRTVLFACTTKHECVMHGGVRLLNCTFAADLNFQGVRVDASSETAVRLDGSRIAGCLWIQEHAGRRAVLRPGVGFSNGVIGNDCVLSGCRVIATTGAAVHFLRTNVGGRTFLGRTDSMRATRFTGTTTFLHCSLNSVMVENLRCSVPTRGSPVACALSFENSVVDGRVNFRSRIAINGPVSLEASCLGVLDDAGLLRRRRPKLVSFDHATYRLHSRATEEDHAKRIEYLECVATTPQPFEHLASELKRTGHEGAAAAAQIGRMKWHARREPSRIKRFGKWVFGWLFGFGYAPHKALVGLLLLFLAALGLSALAECCGYIAPVRPEVVQPLQRGAPGSSVPFSSLGMALDSLLPGSPYGTETEWKYGVSKSSSIVQSVLVWVFQTIAYAIGAAGWLFAAALGGWSSRLLRRP